MSVFVTGATAGFGLAIAKKFAADGLKVVGTGRRAARLDELKAELGKRFHAVTFDVGKREDVETAIAGLPAEFADVDILVNNAGGALGLDPAQSANLDDWDEMIASNINGLVYCTRLLLPGMVARQRGHVINLGSVAGEFPYPGGNVYGAAKAFVHQFSNNLRADLLGTGVRVTDIQPGLTTGTEFSQVRFKGDAKKAAAVYEGTEPLTADDVADAVYWVATRPAHVNINVVQMMPTCQAFGPVAGACGADGAQWLARQLLAELKFRAPDPKRSAHNGGKSGTARAIIMYFSLRQPGRRMHPVSHPPFSLYHQILDRE